MPTIRPCVKDDFDGVLALLHQLWPERELNPTALHRVFRHGLAAPGELRFFCAEEEGRLCGFCSLALQCNLRQAGRMAQINELVVDTAARGRGIGSALLETAMREARAEGCGRVELESALPRTEAHRFYQSRGFENRACLFSKEL